MEPSARGSRRTPGEPSGRSSLHNHAESLTLAEVGRFVSVQGGGVVSPAALRTKQRVGMDRSRLKRFINQRLSEVPLESPVFVSPATPVGKAVALMQEGSHPCVLAGDASGITGIFTERDLLLKCTADDFDWEQPLEASVLTREPRTISAGQTVAEAIAIMQQFNYRTLPVVNEGRVVGLVRLGGLLTHLAEAFPEDVLNLPPRPHQVMEKREGG